MIYCSKEARKVLDFLDQYGIDVPLGEKQRFDLEVCCSLFYPNHIIGVVQKVLKGGNALAKLNRAQSDGWKYFAAPVRSMLKGRHSAHHQNQPDPDDIENRAWAAKVYSIVITTLVYHDINRSEANSLIWEVPPLVGNRNALLEAIQVCRSQDARSIPYLRGVLIREDAKREARKYERRRLASGDLWEPATDPIENLGPVQDDWDEKRKDIDLIQSMEEYAKDQGHRDGT